MSVKTRFTVMSLFVERQLFSLRTTKDKSFAIFLPPARWTMPDGKPRVFKETHITAHIGRPVENGFGYKIKRSGITENNEEFDSSIIVRDDTRDGLLYPIYSSLNGAHSSPLFKGAKKSRKIELIGLTGIEESLCYTVFASSPHIEPPTVQGFSKYSEIQGELRFTIYVTFFHSENVFVNISGSETPPYSRLDGEPWRSAGHSHNPVSFVANMRSWEIERYLQHTHLTLASDYMMLALNDVASKPNFSRTPGTFHRWPSVDDTFHTQYGIMSRAKNPVYAAPLTVDGFPKTAQQMNHQDIINVFQNPSALLDSLPPEVRAYVSEKTIAAVKEFAEKKK